MLMTTAISKEAIAQSERANGGFRVIARWVQGQCRDGSCWPTVSPLPSSSPSPTSSLRDIRSVFINIAPRRLMLTNGVVAAAIITVTDLSSQVGFMYLLTRSAVKIHIILLSLFLPGIAAWFVI
uniref:Uncharacterized protein n=1 Tax=Oryza meridionalis TaxID=40149 RepID=A0A0E0DJN9_9ORYZ